MLAIDPREQRSAEEREECAIFTGAIRHLEARNRAAVVVHKIQADDLTVADVKPAQLLQIPENIAYIKTGYLLLINLQ